MYIFMSNFKHFSFEDSLVHWDEADPVVAVAAASSCAVAADIESTRGLHLLRREEWVGGRFGRAERVDRGVCGGRKGGAGEEGV